MSKINYGKNRNKFDQKQESAFTTSKTAVFAL